ncbi:hypothetical protein RUM44_000425 [Polyplax serrata]|uniref:Uncharacterized protein n=1 Tax=Polyplax serrata TaxID=468196 RepID=A0ABR1B5I5_POLSC
MRHHVVAAYNIHLRDLARTILQHHPRHIWQIPLTNGCTNNRTSTPDNVTGDGRKKQTTLTIGFVHPQVRQHITGHCQIILINIFSTDPYTAKVSVPKSGTDNTRVRIILKEKPEERWQPEIIRRENRSATANEGISLWYLRVFARGPP